MPSILRLANLLTALSEFGLQHHPLLLRGTIKQALDDVVAELVLGNYH